MRELDSGRSTSNPTVGGSNPSGRAPQTSQMPSELALHMIGLSSRMQPDATRCSSRRSLPEYIRNDLGDVSAGRQADSANFRNDSEPPRTRRRASAWTETLRRCVLVSPHPARASMIR